MERAQVLNTDLSFSLDIAGHWLCDLGQIDQRSTPLHLSLSALSGDPCLSLFSVHLRSSGSGGTITAQQH